MFRLIYLILLCGLPFKSFASFYSDDPERYKERISKQVARHVKMQPKVYFLGDEHDVDQGQLLVDLSTEILKQDSRVNCLFLEMPTAYFQSALQEYIQNGNYEIIREGSRRLQANYGVEENPIAETEKKRMIDWASKAGFQVFAIDQLPTQTEIQYLRDLGREAELKRNERLADFLYESLTYLYGYKRNGYIAREMKELITNGTCEGAIAVNGNSHLSGGTVLKTYGLISRPLQLILQHKYELGARVLVTIR